MSLHYVIVLCREHRVLFHLSSSLVCTFVLFTLLLSYSPQSCVIPHWGILSSDTSVCPLCPLFCFCSSAIPLLHLSQCIWELTSEFLNKIVIMDWLSRPECNFDDNCLSVADDYCQASRCLTLIRPGFLKHDISGRRFSEKWIYISVEKAKANEVWGKTAKAPSLFKEMICSLVSYDRL